MTNSPSEDRFAAYVAHELRTPLATQRAQLELALSDPTVDAAAWRGIGEDLLRACRYQERLLEACLVLTRSRGGARSSERVDLAAIAGETLQAQDRGQLECVVALEPARVTGEPSLVERLVANLISNAIRHNMPGGLLEISTGIESRRAVLFVANTGRLIPSAELPRLFQPFQRLDSRPRCFADGVGLGLAIVESIAAAHRARVTARARIGGGLEVDVSFPAVR